MGTLPSDGLPDRVREITDQLLTEFTTIGFLSDDDGSLAARAAGRDHRGARLRPARARADDRGRPSVAGLDPRPDRRGRSPRHPRGRRDQPPPITW